DVSDTPGDSGAFSPTLPAYVFGQLTNDAVVLGGGRANLILNGDVPSGTIVASPAITPLGTMTTEGDVSVAASLVYSADPALMTTEGDIAVAVSPLFTPAGTRKNATSP